MRSANEVDESLARFRGRCKADFRPLDLPPALPQQWSRRSLYGVRVHGGAVLSMQWSGGKVDALTWRATKTTKYELRLPAGQHLRTVRAGNSKQTFYQDATGVVQMRTIQGQTYSLEF